MSTQKKWEIEYYETERGRCPTIEFRDGLSKQDQVFIDKAEERLENYGRDLRRPHVDYLRDKIWELRIRTNHGQYRLLYFFFDGHKFVITHGISKKTDEVPDKEINKAIDFRTDYLKRNS